MDLENLRNQVEKARKLADREQAACMRKLRGLRPSSKRTQQRIQQLLAQTRTFKISRRVETEAGYEECTQEVHYTSLAYAGNCRELAIQAQRRYDSAMMARSLSASGN